MILIGRHRLRRVGNPLSHRPQLFQIFKESVRKYSVRAYQNQTSRLRLATCFCTIFRSVLRYWGKDRTMKRLFYIVFFILCLLSTGQAQTIRNSNNSAIATIESDGTVRSSNHFKIGNIQSDGVIRNSNGAQIGKLENDGTVRDRSGRHIGKIESDGTVRNSNNSQIGKVESDGTVRNSNNSSIGSAKGVPQRYAALYFFFDFFK